MPETIRVAALAGQVVARVNVNPTNSQGQPGLLDGAVTWQAIHPDGPTICEIQPANDEQTKVDLISTGEPGTVVIRAQADGDLGDEVSTLVQEVTIEFVAPLTTNLNLRVDVVIPAPADQEEPAPPAE